MPRKAVDHTGKRFGRLVVIARDPSKGGQTYWRCSCDCGHETTTRASRLLSGATQSCGCLVPETAARVSYKHGHHSGGKPTPTYQTWSSIKDRCGKAKHYKNVRLCERWRNSFEAFYEDMGERPDGMTIDRIDPAGDYEPKNCRWATVTQQNRNKRDNHLLTYKGETLTITAWAERLRVPHSVLYTRAKLGWPATRIIEQPVAPRSHSSWRNK